MAGPRIPKWLRDQFFLDDAVAYGTPPSLDHIIARAGGVQRQMSAEDFLRALVQDARSAEQAAIRSADSALTADTNIFGLPVKTIEQGRALGERNLPGIKNLSPEDQIALAEALDKGAMLRAMTGVAPGRTTELRMPRGGRGDLQPLPSVRYGAGNRADQITGRGTPYIGGTPLDMGSALALLQNKRGYRKAFGVDPGDLPMPEVFSYDFDGIRPSEPARALGDDVADLASTIRQDQIDSRLLQAREAADEMNLIETQNEMGRAADAVAAQEAYARQYGGFDPQTRREMDRSVRRDKMLQEGTLGRLTGDPMHSLNAKLPDDSIIPPAAPPTQDELLSQDILKGFLLGHVLSYPIMYGAYRYADGQWPFGGKDTEANFPPQGPAVHLGEEASKKDDPFMAAVGDLPQVPVELPDMPVVRSPEPQPVLPAEEPFDAAVDSLPEVPVDLPDMDVIRTPETAVGLPEDDMAAIDSLGDDAELAAEQSPPPTIQELDAELRAGGFDGVPDWYIKAMANPNVKMIGGVPKEQYEVFSTPGSVQRKAMQEYLRRGGRMPAAAY